MKNQITLLIVRAVLSAGISLSQQPQAAAASVSDEVRQMCDGEVIERICRTSRLSSVVLPTTPTNCPQHARR
jgi:hypothetical protein